MWAICAFVPRAERWGAEGRPTCAHMWATSEFVVVQSIGDPRDGKGYVAGVPTRGPFLILSPYRALGTPETAGVR